MVAGAQNRLAREWGRDWVALRADDVDLDRDAALVERFQTGDEDAFADLYRRYFGRLRRYCQRRLGNPHDAEEAAQEALVKAYRALPTFGGDRRFYPWLRVIAANVCTDRCKRKPVAALADAEGGDVVVDSVFDRLDHAFVQAALRELNPRHQAALSLWAEGHPSRYIAEELGCSTGAVDVTLHRARQSFRTRFLAIAGDGRFAGLLVPAALGRWAQRWRARIVTRAGQHADLATPLAAKLAAGAIAITVVGGAVATGSSPAPVSPTAPPAPIVRVQTSPASATVPVPPVTQTPTTPQVPTPVKQAPTSQAAPTSAPGRAKEVGPLLVTSNEDARQRSAGSPIEVHIGHMVVTADPQNAVDAVNNRLQGK